jgi:ATP-binding cassette subfamily B protein
MRSFTQDRSVADHRLAPGTVRRILGFARPYRVQIGLFLGLVLLDALIGAATPLVYRAIIDHGIGEGRTSVVLAMSAALAGLAVVSAGLGLGQRLSSARIGEGLVFDLRTRVYEHVQRMPIAFFSRTQTGALVTRLNGDVQGAQQAFTSTLSNVVGNVVGVAATLAAMLALSWRITLLALVLLPLFVLPARWVGRRLADITRERYQLNADMGQVMTERFNVAGALLVKLFGRPEEDADAFAQRAGRVRDIGVTSAFYSRVFMTSLGLVAALATALIYALGGTMAIAGSLGVGTVVALTAYLQRLYGPLTALSNVQVDIMATLVSFERVLEVLDFDPIITDASDARSVPDGPVTVEFDAVSFRYPSAAEVSLASLESVASLPRDAGALVLDDVSFQVEPGQMVALVGPSGAGKSTIAGLVARIHDTTSGSVRIGGLDLRSATQKSIRDAVGVVAQDAHMFHDTLRANLLYANPTASEADLVAALRAAHVWDVVRSLPDGLDTVVGDRGHRLSGGEKQRLAIARLLLKDPRVVVLDEATAHLDSESEAAVQRALSAALAGRTAIVIAHRLATIRDADQILVVDGGHIVERGTHDELLRAGGPYADLSRTQFLTADPPATTVPTDRAGSLGQRHPHRHDSPLRDRRQRDIPMNPAQPDRRTGRGGDRWQPSR